LEAIAKQRGLDKMVSWPVSIGYFDNARGDLTPAYQIDFILYANGVSRELHIDYGDFSIIGHLSHLDYLPPDKCD
jgi:EipB-like